jgi:cytochrome b561
MQHVDKYNSVAKFLHWSIAALIIANYILGLTLDDNSLYTLHKQTGLTILLLVVLRIIWRLSSKYPAKLAEVSNLEQLAAVGGQIMLYVLMILIPVSGVLMTQAHGYPLSFWGIIPIPKIIGEYPRATTHLIKEFHEWMAHAIIILAGGHAVIALIHHYFAKDRLLRRMLPNVCNKNAK